ncbi:hypothetical protein EYF80_054476 [Liparis tanakae]|uniref:Uncharacterized protein n=1 Tax=Liparis tanakae TaxID=230148 RepID=A0A4Z2F2J0_9TELE|nr:hypothetical protein EYF80_054476 [Liparis tanakae]
MEDARGNFSLRAPPERKGEEPTPTRPTCLCERGSAEGTSNTVLRGRDRRSQRVGWGPPYGKGPQAAANLCLYVKTAYGFQDPYNNTPSRC